VKTAFQKEARIKKNPVTVRCSQFAIQTTEEDRNITSVTLFAVNLSA
jgi:hypothetical protein